MRISALSKQIGVLAATSLLVAALVIYVITTLLAGDRKSKAAERMADLFGGLTELAQNNLIQKNEGKAIDLQKDVVANLETTKSLLNALYEGKFIYNDLVAEEITFDKPKSEDRKALIKQALVAVGKLQDLVKTGDEKAIAQFGVVNASIQNITKDYAGEALQTRHRVEFYAWTSVAVIVLFLTALTIIAYRQLKRSEQQITSARLKVDEENKRVEQLSNFIEAMASGNYDMKIETDTKDELSATLVSMRDKLKNNAEQEQRRNWANTGLARIGEILRDSGNAIALYDKVIKYVVKYTNSNQGGLFILDDTDTQDPFLDLLACYAFERKKFLTKKVGIGQGLVGQCFMEQEQIHLTEIPEEYIRITSGLGGDKPQSLLLMPLKVNDKIFGVLELASFHFYPEHVVELVAKFAENIASTISNVKINESTRVLLEQTQQQAEEMKAQEEEMRQNMEELSATQEEMHRKEREYISRIQHLEAQASLAERV